MLLLNITVIIMVYLVFVKHQEKQEHWYTKIEIDGTEYRLSIIENTETSSYGITLTLTNMKERPRILRKGRDYGNLTLNYRGKMITGIDITGGLELIRLEKKTLVFSSNIRKKIIDEYLRQNGLLQEGKRGLLDFDKPSYPLDFSFYTGMEKEPMILTISHEAGK